MSYSIASVDYEALPAALLDLAKQHMRVDFPDDDVVIKEYLQWSIGYCEQFWALQIFAAEVDWIPAPAGGCSRYQCPVQPVSAFVVTSDGADVSSGYALQQGALTQPVWLVKNDGANFPADAAVNLTAGYTDAAAMPPAARANILRVAGTLYEHRESVSTLTLDQMPFWLTDMLAGLWVPRA